MTFLTPSIKHQGLNQSLNQSIKSRFSLITLSIFSLISTPLQADTFLGLYASADYWNSTLDGAFASSGNQDLFDGFSSELEKEQHSVLTLRFEHGIPLIPNFYVRQNNIAFNDQVNLTEDRSISGVSFSASAPLDYDFDLSHTDIALYYEILDNWLSLDLGLGLKALTFDYELAQNAQVYRFEEDGNIPMVFGRAEFELPFSGWKVDSTLMALSFESDRIHDFQIGLGYAPNNWIAFAAGWRRIEVDIEVPGLDQSTLNLDGAYLNATVHL